MDERSVPSMTQFKTLKVVDDITEFYNIQENTFLQSNNVMVERVGLNLSYWVRRIPKSSDEYNELIR